MAGVRTRFITVSGWQRRTKVSWLSPGGCGVGERNIGGAYCESDTRVLHVGDGEIPSNSEAVEHELLRVGDAEAGAAHVDKAGLTCAAGAGSIQTHNWHGFLHHGSLNVTG